MIKAKILLLFWSVKWPLCYDRVDFIELVFRLPEDKHSINSLGDREFFTKTLDFSKIRIFRTFGFISNGKTKKNPKFCSGFLYLIITTMKLLTSQILII